MAVVYVDGSMVDGTDYDPVGRTQEGGGKTVKKLFQDALTILSAGDTCYVRDATYRIPSAHSNSYSQNGTLGSPIIVQKYAGDANPVVTRMELEDGSWSDLGGGIYSIAVPASTWVVHVSEGATPYTRAIVGDNAYGDNTDISAQSQWITSTPGGGGATLYVRTSDDAAPASRIYVAYADSYRVATLGITGNYWVLDGLSLEGSSYVLSIGGGTNMMVQNCTIFNCQKDGIKAGTAAGDPGTISSCTFYDCGKTAGNAIDMNGRDGWQILDCTFSGLVGVNSSSGAIMMKTGCSNIVVDRCSFYGYSAEIDGLIYVGGYSSGGHTYEAQDCIIRNCIFRNCPVDGVIYFAGTDGCEVVGNLIFACTVDNAIITAWPGSGSITGNTNATFKNNIIASCVGTGWYVEGAGSWGSGCLSDYNLYSDGAQQKGGEDVNSTIGVPVFVDGGANNYRPLAGSPVIDVGTTLASLPLDYDGVSRPQGAAVDCGPFEAVTSVGETELWISTGGSQIVMAAGSPEIFIS